MYIREAMDSDGPGIVALVQLCWDKYVGKGQVLDVFPTLLSSPRTSHSMYWVVEDQGKIVGSVACTLRGSEGEAQKLYVHPDYRKHGLGGELVDTMLRWLELRGAQWAIAYTDIQLVEAHRLYRANGWIFGPPIVMPDAVRYKITKLLEPRKGRWFDHPHSRGLTYWEHFKRAMGFSRVAGQYSLALSIHAVFPWLFTNKASGLLRRLLAALRAT